MCACISKSNNLIIVLLVLFSNITVLEESFYKRISFQFFSNSMMQKFIIINLSW